MDIFAFFCTDGGFFCETAVSSFLLSAYLIFIVPAVLAILAFKFRRRLANNVYKSLAVLATVVLTAIVWFRTNPGEDVLAVFLNFVFAPFLIIGSVIWAANIKSDSKWSQSKKLALRAHALLILLLLAANLFA